ncbi:hypothetical protein MSAN_01110200 [Mycena sanguinolenta]|uniref:Uncharacterized protein n=1 Tax=Mycena sanguinolenta TaxID=230812 RepID=A0A8H6YGJ0_9AGAR|nr:hypothetical protein MSAN_01110200 [Mycena sanguinolenta]
MGQCPGDEDGPAVENTEDEPTNGESDDGGRDGGEEEEMTAAQKKATRDGRMRWQITKRAQAIVGEGSKPPITPDELMDLIITPVITTYQKEEDMALSRVLRGFRNAGSWRAWARIVEKYIGLGEQGILEFCEASERFDADGELLERDLVISHTEAGNEIEYSFKVILQKIETIKFARGWNGLTGTGALTTKSNYNRQLFQRINSDDFAGLSPAAVNKKMEELSGEFEVFKRSRGELVTARNRLSFAYHNFGTAVLIDPFFNVPNLGAKRAKKFQSLLDTLIRLAEKSRERQRAEHLADLEEENRDALRGLVKCFLQDAG